MFKKEYNVYYNEGGLTDNEYQLPNDPENIQPTHGPGDPGHGHGHEIQPSHRNHMIYNSSSVNDYDFSYVIINVVFNLLLCLVFLEVFKRCYLRYLLINQQNRRQRLIIEEEEVVNYSHNRVVVREIVKEDVCSICLEELFPEDVENTNVVIELNCNHMFHKECLDPWIKINKNCPLCKNNV